MINLHERMLPTLAGVEPMTSWSPVRRRIQLSHRGGYGCSYSLHIYKILITLIYELYALEAANNG